MIKSRAISIFILFLIAGLFTVVIGNDAITGEYLEARSVDVYVGACHFGSEYVEGGKEATVVWNINQGMWKGVSLRGLTVVAVVSAQKNLDIDSKTRRSVLYVSSRANQLQQEMLIDLIKQNYMKTLGQLVETKVTTINFQKSEWILDHGGLDLILERKYLRGTIAKLLQILLKKKESEAISSPDVKSFEEDLQPARKKQII